MSKEIKVSVIIPIYNAEGFLEQGLSDLLNQTLKEIEIICVNDGSTDRTEKILSLMQAEDDRIKVISQNNQYAGIARNNGLNVAEGKYVIFLDSDDMFEPDLLEELFNKAEANECDICICNAKSYNAVTGKTRKAKYLKTEYLPEKEVFSYRDIPEHIFQIINPAPWNKLYKRNFLIER